MPDQLHCTSTSRASHLQPYFVTPLLRHDSAYLRWFSTPRGCCVPTSRLSTQGPNVALEHNCTLVGGPQKFARAGAMICNLGPSLARWLTGAVPCLIWTRHAEASLSPDNCSFLQKNISLPHISEFTFLLLNQVVGEPGGVARGASTAQLARSGRRTHNEEAQRDTSDRPALWLPWAIHVVAFRVFSPISDLSMFFYRSQREKQPKHTRTRRKALVA